MMISEDEIGVEGVARFHVFIDDQLIPHHAVCEANEEAFYALLYRLDATGQRVVKADPGHHPTLGLVRYTYPKYVRYGRVEIKARKP